MVSLHAVEEGSWASDEAGQCGRCGPIWELAAWKMG